MKHSLFGLTLAAFAVAATAGDAKVKAFKDLDADADGKLSNTEVAAMSDLKREFRVADSNADGYLSPSEFDSWVTARPAAKQPPTG